MSVIPIRQKAEGGGLKSKLDPREKHENMYER
jgi:hypothetical protein